MKLRWHFSALQLVQITGGRNNAPQLQAREDGARTDLRAFCRIVIQLLQVSLRNAHPHQGSVLHDESYRAIITFEASGR